MYGKFTMANCCCSSKSMAESCFYFCRIYEISPSSFHVDVGKYVLRERERERERERDEKRG